MGKKQIRELAVLLAAFLLACTFYSRSYEREHTLCVKTQNPQWTEERMLLLPKDTLLDAKESCVWTVKTVSTIWGVQQVLEKESIIIYGEEDGCILAQGLLKGAETQVVTECKGEPQPGSRVIIEE